ncbi:MAG: hypothetical protein DSM106950_31730 [Stigonema ocellatum SAG 48.90 = DSM 106950]|nr:hypothetical protein [Stigonema ocellatum SAG 48.90 = DSM 106950]
MTSPTDEIQTLIAEINNLLAHKGNRLTNILSNQGQEARQVLERTRDFLMRLAQSAAQAGSAENQREQLSELSPLLTRFVDQTNPLSFPQQNQPNQEHGTFVDPTQSNSAFSALLMPLQVELLALLQERTTLVQEIRELEQRRLQNYSLAQQLATQEKMISDFLQVLMSRLTSTLTPLGGEISLNSPQEPVSAMDASSSSLAAKKDNTELAISSSQPSLLSPDPVERLTRLAKELDQQILGLDGTVNVVFEALQRNIHTYDESLSQALARIHSKGVQGEQLIASWINNLMEQLEQQTANHNPSTLNREHETSSPTAFSATTADPLDSRAQFPVGTHQSASHSLEVTQVKTSSTLANNEALEHPSTRPDQDAVVLPLNDDTQKPTAKVVELQQGNSELISDQSDQVDQLYASLFGTENLTDSSLEPTSRLEVTDVTHGSSFTTTGSESTTDQAPAPEVVAPSANQVTDATHGSSFATIASEANTDQAPAPEVVAPSANQVTPVTNQVPQVDAVVIPDPWFDEPDAGLLDFRNPNTQDNSVKTTGEISDLYNTLISRVNTEEVSPVGVATSNFIEEPVNSDTITVLSDLFVSSEQLSEVPSSDIAASLPIPANSEVTGTPEGAIANVQDSELSSEHYILASPQENLLAHEEGPTTAVADISLEEEQLRQLEQDLAEFDAALNFYLQPATNLENPETAQKQSDGELHLNTTQAVFAEAEKKKEVTIESDDSVISISNSTESLHILDSVWYLGIDLGTTGISAALLNRSTTEIYPLYWSAQNQPQAAIKRSFRLPAEVYVPTASVTYSETESKEVIEQTIPAAVGEELVPDNLATSAGTQNLFSAQLKPYLQVAIPYKSERQKWEPVLQLNEFSTVPLVWIVRSLSKLLLTLKSDAHSTTIDLTAGAVGQSQQTLRSIINNLAGVICTCPSNWSEQYRFNVREALLISKLVQHPQQVFFVEEAIASLLSELDGANGESVKLITPAGSSPAKTSDHPLVGSTLVINIGAAFTEMALVDVPSNLEDLTHSDFMLHGFAYAGKGIEQDIICQLLFSPKWRQSPIESSTSKAGPWQPAIPGLDQMHLSSLKWEELNLPRAGEPDIIDRIRLQQRLESSVLGKAILDAAKTLKLILQHQESFTLELADYSWMLQRRDLESQVFVPFVRRLNRELNRLLVAKGIPTEAINQAILTGGVASIGAVSRWLRQKLPNAKIIQDLYLGENGAPACSRVTYGLAVLPLHPQVLEVPRQQYTDYFLFTELLRVLPERALSFDEVIQLFENRGINTRNCQQRLLAFLEGELPPGFMPSNLDSCWLPQSANQNAEYQAIAQAPLFEKQGSLTYRPNSQQLQSLCRYVDTIKASTQQLLEEPYTVNFAVGVVH